jgi:hypothetical protein
VVAPATRGRAVADRTQVKLKIRRVDRLDAQVYGVTLFSPSEANTAT